MCSMNHTDFLPRRHRLQSLNLKGAFGPFFTLSVKSKAENKENNREDL